MDIDTKDDEFEKADDEMPKEYGRFTPAEGAAKFSPRMEGSDSEAGINKVDPPFHDYAEEELEPASSRNLEPFPAPRTLKRMRRVPANLVRLLASCTLE